MRAAIRILLIITLIDYTALSAQELTLYAMPAPRALRWISPGGLITSYLNNYFFVPNKYPHQRHAMGHVMVELRDDKRHELVGLAAERRGEMFRSVLKYQYGLGCLFSGYNGIMETAADYEPQLEKRYKHGDVAYITFMLSPKMFDMLWDYLQGYRERGYHKIYNGLNRPREGKGSGCSAFGASFIELAGLMDAATLQQWQLRVNIQERFIGGPIGRHREVNTLRMILTRHWADTTREAYRSLSYYEPTLIYNWICTEFTRPGSPYTAQLRGKAKGLIIDRRHASPPPVEIWQASR